MFRECSFPSQAYFPPPPLTPAGCPVEWEEDTRKVPLPHNLSSQGPWLGKSGSHSRSITGTQVKIVTNDNHARE